MSTSVLTAAKTVVRWLRWAAVLALVYHAWSGLAYAAWHVRTPAPFAAIQQMLEILYFHTLTEAAFVVTGALIAPRARRATAIVLAAVHVPLLLWNHVLSRVNLAEFVLLEGTGNYGLFTLETLGAVLGVVYVFWSENAQESPERVPPSQSSLVEPPPGPGRAKPAPTAAKTVIRWLRWAAVLTLVYSTLGVLVYSALGEVVSSTLGQGAPAQRPAPLAGVQVLVSLLLFYTLREAAFVVAGALIAPRARLATAIVLAAALVPFSFWAHVLATGGPWRFWTINYTHFSLEACGCILGVVYIFFKSRGRTIDVP